MNNVRKCKVLLNVDDCGAVRRWSLMKKSESFSASHIEDQGQKYFSFGIIVVPLIGVPGEKIVILLVPDVLSARRDV